MTTYKLGLPAELRRSLEDTLPPKDGKYRPTVRVTPRDRRERKCPAYDADHYEVHAFYTTTNWEALNALEDALRGVPGVYATTQVRPVNPGSLANMFTNPDWPAPLGTGRRDRNSLRAQVIALIRDPAAKEP